MLKRDIIAIFYRLGEMLIGSVIMSAVVCFLCFSRYMPVGSIQRDITLILLPIIYIVWNVFMLRGCYMVVGERIVYYVINLCATVMFMFISAAAYLFLPKELYSWAFLVTYLGGFTTLGISGKVAILLFDIIITASVFFSIANMWWVQEELEDINDSFENLPPEMEITPQIAVRNAVKETKEAK